MKLIKQYPLSCATLLAICVLSLMPADELPDIDARFIDKWVHVAMYGGLSCTLWWEYCIKKACPFHRGKAGLVCLLFPVAWGGLMELVQAYLTTYRSGDWLDFLANSIGAILASVAGYTVCFHRQKGKARK